MTTIPFSLDEYLKDNTRAVIDADGNPYEIVPIQISPQFYSFVPKGIDPTTCVTYHLHRIGSNAYPVIGAGAHLNLFIVEK